MAPDDFWARKRKEEEQEEREREEAEERANREAKNRRKAGIISVGQSFEPVIGGRFDDMIREAPVLIEQLNHLYNQFIAGVVALPPREIRGRLDHMMILLANEHKPTPSSRFKFQSVQESYKVHCARWDKMLHDLESGKIKRVTGRPRFGG